MSFKQVSVDEAKQLIEAGDITILDIRDSQSYSMGHISNAIHAEGIDINSFIIEKEKEKPLLVYCYHGHSSQTAAKYFMENGFSDVYSMDGGYTAWAQD
jgi:thiosulfate sulfurtransferase